jgi:multiple sugar transport system substrate-binding protein
MWKKATAAVLAGLMALSLAACNNNTASSTPESQGGNTSTASEAETHDPVTIMMWQTSGDERPYMNKLREDFQKEYDWIKLDIVQTPENSDLLSAMAAGTNPDVFGTGYPQFSTLIYQGAFLELDEYVNSTPDYQNFVKDQVETFMSNGHYYGVPGGRYVLGMNYNKEMFEAAGIKETPKTWDEFLETCKKLTKADKSQYGYSMNMSQWAGWHFEMWAWAAGGEISLKDEATGKLTLTFDDPKNVEAGEFYRTLIKEGVVQPDINIDNDGVKKEFSQGRAAMTIGGMGDVSGAVSDGMKAENIGFFDMPAGPSGKGYNIDGGDGSGIVYTEDKNKADACWKYLMYTSSKTAYEEQLKEAASQGGLSPRLCPRSDIDVASFAPDDDELFDELQSVLEKGSKSFRHEYYGKGATGSFLDDAVAKFCGDLNVDIAATLKEYQDKAADAVEEFNKALEQKAS